MCIIPRLDKVMSPLTILLSSIETPIGCQGTLKRKQAASKGPKGMRWSCLLCPSYQRSSPRLPRPGTRSSLMSPRRVPLFAGVTAHHSLCLSDLCRRHHGQSRHRNPRKDLCFESKKGSKGFMIFSLLNNSTSFLHSNRYSLSRCFIRDAAVLVIDKYKEFGSRSQTSEGES